MGLVSEYPLWGPELVRLYVSYGSTQRALALSAALKEAADRMRVPYARGAALLAEGLIKDNLEMLLAAVDAYAKSPRLSIWRGPEKMPPLSWPGRGAGMTPSNNSRVRFAPTKL